MSTKIAVIVPNNTIKQQTEMLFAHEIVNDEISVIVINVMNIAEEGERLINEGVSAIIARGGTYLELKQSMDRVPVVEMPVQSSDILFALKAAKDSYKNIYLLLHANIYFEYEEYKNILDIDIVYKKYTSVESLKKILNEIPCGPDSVVVGSGACAELSIKDNLNTIPVSMQNSTIMNAYEYTKNLLAQTREEKRKVNLLESILYNVDNGVIIVDKSGVIKHFNRKSEQLLGLSYAQAVTKNISSVIPGITLDAMKKDIIVSMGARSLVLNSNQFTIYAGEEQYIITLNDVTKLQELEKNIRFKLARRGLVATYTFSDFVTCDQHIKKLISRAESVAGLDASVIIYGESGTGKELFAQSIHNASKRKNGPFVAINCTALPETLLESELFGYVGGAFTGARKEGKTGLFELAHGGTVFLDEINSMSLALQAKILRVIEQREILRVGSDYIIPLDVRIISASNKRLIESIAQGEFRQDLYFRLNHFEIILPPMNERKEDIILLFKHFVAHHKNVPAESITLDEPFAERLRAHKWWGNVREIKNTALRYHIFNGDNSSGDILPDTACENSIVTDDLRIDIDELGNAIESHVITALIAKNISKTAVAKLLGISRQALYKKIARLRL